MNLRCESHPDCAVNSYPVNCDPVTNDEIFFT